MHPLLGRRRQHRPFPLGPNLFESVFVSLQKGKAETTAAVNITVKGKVNIESEAFLAAEDACPRRSVDTNRKKTFIPKE